MNRGALILAAVCAFGPATGFAQDESKTPKKTFQVTPAGYIQLDFRAFPQWSVQPGTGSLNRDYVEVRRLRGGVDGHWRRLAFEVKLDPKDEDGVFLKDAYAEFEVNKSMRLRGGQFKLPGSREYLTSAKNIDFIERTALSTALAAGRDIGGVVDGSLGKRLDFQAGLFAGDGNGRRERAGMTSAARIEWKPLKALELATSLTEGRIRKVADDQPENGLEGRMPSGYRFFPRLYEQGRRLRVATDIEWDLGAWRITAEGLRVRDQRVKQGLDYEDLASLISRGWSIGTWWRFGKARHLGLRYEWIGFDDAGPETGRDSVRPRASDVRARAAQAVTAGLSWKPHSLLRFMGNAALERYSEARAAPEAGRVGNYYTISSRIQFEWP
jgi:hypothetical protein